jgi:hypothetical protein
MWGVYDYHRGGVCGRVYVYQGGVYVYQGPLYTGCVVGHRKGAGQAILTMILGDYLGWTLNRKVVDH